MNFCKFSNQKLSKWLICFSILFSFYKIPYAQFDGGEIETIHIKKVDVIGLVKISKETVLATLEKLPAISIKEFSPAMTSQIIHELYRTNFFDNIEIYVKDSTLIIKVQERPIIASVKVNGNKDIPKEQMNSVLRQIGLYKGQMFDRAALDKIEQLLKSQYINRGRYNSTVSTKINSLSRNRVEIVININEGESRLIRRIHIIGNKQFSEQTLINQMMLSTPGLLTFFNDKDKYTKEKLEESIEALKNYYLDRGFAKIAIESYQVLLSPNTDQLSISIKINEGEIYTIKNYHLAGNIVVPRSELENKIMIKAGELFSRKSIQETVIKITELLADKGYTFSSVDVQPDINEKDKTVSINFFINPGRPIYIRKIRFTGNHKTADYVLRRAFRQLEGSLWSLSKEQESLRQIRVLGYITDVKIEHQSVPGTNNQVDFLVHVTEGQIMEMSASAGLGTLGLEFNAGINNHNIFGTGSSGGLNFRHDSWGNVLSLSYFNPYATKSGIGQGFNLYYQNQQPGRSFASGLTIIPYITDRLGAAINYTVPFSDNHNLTFGLGVEELKLKILASSQSKAGKNNQKSISTQLDQFRDAFGTFYRQFRLNLGWVRSTYDQLPFPTRGTNQSIEGFLALPLNKVSLKYYKVGYTGKIYQPLFQGFILGLLGGVKYGSGFQNKYKNRNGVSDLLPFYENYYAGGIGLQGQVRGYETASLGPKDSNFDPLGGNLLVYGSISLILPKPLSRDTIRTSIFLDFGNVYQTSKDTILKGSNPGKIRFSAGVGVEWHTPLGPINFSLAFALNPHKDPRDKRLSDKTEIPGFSMAHGF